MTKNKKNGLKISKRISNHLIEAFLIFASVFFAFWLTEYRESRNNETALKISLQHIASEMKYNHKRVELIYEYQSNLILEIDSLRKQTNIDWEKLNGEDLTIWEGIQLPALRSTAYQTFLNSNISDNAEFQLVKSLADIYNTQSIIERLDNSIFEVVIADKQLTNLTKIRHLAEIYTGILPDVMMQYQFGKKNWFYKYGYDLEITNNKLKKIIDERTLQR